MTFDQIPFSIAAGLVHFLAAFGVVAAMAIFVGLVISLFTFGSRGPALAWDVLVRGLRDVFAVSPRRIGAIASLTIKESYRKKAFAVLIVFLLLFMFAGFFLQSPDRADDVAAKPFIAFILTTIRWMCLPVALLLACWGLPTDIKDRSLHTVVTKPVRRSEVVMGRMLGYGAVTTSFLVVMSVLGYIFIEREVPERSQAQLISRVPVYGSLRFIDRDGNEAAKGINTGDIWDYRSYIEGVTKATAIWKFDDLNVEKLKSLPELRLENSFEAFRSHKGSIGDPIRYRLTLVNPKTKLRVSNGELVRGVAEFSSEVQRADTTATLSQEGEATVATTKQRPSTVMSIPREISYIDVAASGSEGQAKKADLFQDLFDGNSLTVEVTCLDSGQHIGAAQSDLFIRLPDRGFASTYFKSIFSLWLMLMLICILGTTASCFVKGPVATLLTFSLLLMGATLRPTMDDLLTQFAEKEKVLGGGVLESLYRIVLQLNQQQDLPRNPTTITMDWIDDRVFDVLGAFRNFIPNFTYFDSSAYTINGFDVSWSASLLPALATTLAYILPCILLGYFSLQLRELEAK